MCANYCDFDESLDLYKSSSNDFEQMSLFENQNNQVKVFKLQADLPYTSLMGEFEENSAVPRRYEDPPVHFACLNGIPPVEQEWPRCTEDLPMDDHKPA